MDCLCKAFDNTMTTETAGTALGRFSAKNLDEFEPCPASNTLKGGEAVHFLDGQRRVLMTLDARAL
jgi:hypothetical protein